MGDEEFKGGRGVVRVGADDFFIVVAVVGEAVGLDHGPVGQVAEEDFGRILDAVLLLAAGAAAEGHIAAAQNGVAADVGVGVDHDDRCAMLDGGNGGGKPRGSRANHHYVGFLVPADGARPRLAWRRA